jgi:hypothetical protein
MQPFIIITAADARYFELVKGAILSIREKRAGQSAVIGFFDLGCTAEQLQWLEDRVDVIRQPKWEFEFPGRDEAPQHLKGLIARPFLPRYFPDFEIYFWIDADAWVQDWRAVELYLQASALKGLGITPEVDRGSRIQYGGLPKYWQWAFNHYYATFGAEEAEKYQSYPMLNAGVFALHRTAPQWQLWAKYLEQGLQRSSSLYTDQMALNLAVYIDSFEQTEMLPAWCNWACHFGLPIWDEQRNLLVEPYVPHTPIGIVHLTEIKHECVELPTTQQGRAAVRMQYTSRA